MTAIMLGLGFAMAALRRLGTSGAQAPQLFGGTLKSEHPVRFVVQDPRSLLARGLCIYETKPMREAQADGERNVVLDLEDTTPVPDASATLRRFQRMLDNHVDDEEPAPPGCSPEVLNPLRASRARANRILLDD